MQYKMGSGGMFLHASKMLSFPPIPVEELFLHLKPSLFSLFYWTCSAHLKSLTTVLIHSTLIIFTTFFTVI